MIMLSIASLNPFTMLASLGLKVQESVDARQNKDSEAVRGASHTPTAGLVLS